MTTLTAGDWRQRTWRFLLPSLLVPPLLPLVASWRRLRHGKATAGLWAKAFGRAPRLTPGAPLVHGVSMGEALLIRPLLPMIEAFVGRPAVLSTTTTTGWEALAKSYPDHPRCFLPLDLPWAVEAFLNRVRPAAVILMESEIWPTFLAACHRRRLPVIILNARLGDRSWRNFRRAGPLLRPLFAGLRLVLAQNAAWGARFRALGCPRVVVTGSLKADLVQPADAAAVAAERTRLGLAHNQPVLLLASTSDPEEEPLIRCWREVAPGWRLVICPRHPERGADLAAFCRTTGANAHRTSTGTTGIPAEAVVIVDEIGRLGALYGLADLAIVGGGLGSGRGSQNMWESAAAGACTVVGTDTRNFPDAIARLRQVDAVRQIDPTDTAGTRATLAALVADPVLRCELGRRARAAWAGAQGARGRCLARLREALTGGSSPP
jgi:3-deoxy-D-manno-octulosonic-acid transferase